MTKYAAPLEERRRRGRSPGRDSGGRRLPEPVVLLPAPEGVPEPPQDLLLAGRELWTRVWTSGAVWLGPTDVTAVEIVCGVVDDLHTARTRYRTTTDPKDGRLVMQLHSQLMSGLAALGLDPTSRGRLGVAEVKKQSALDELLSKRASRG